MKSTIALLAWIAVSFLPALSGAVFPPGEWYAKLDKPAWTPPGAVFGPVWTVLYTLMGFSAWLVWRRDGFRGARLAFIVFLIQLALNGLWSVLFFGAHSPALAFADIIVLLLAIGTTIILFRRHRPLAGELLAPYLVWVAFAAALNFQLWRLNP